MESLFRQLLDILSEEKEAYMALIELSAEKKEAIVGSAFESLDRIIREEQALIAKIQDRERARSKCVMALAQLSGGNDANLQAFSGLASTQEEKVRLEALQSALPQIIEQLRSLNDINRKLIESRLKYVRFVIDSVSPDSGAAAYGAHGDDESINKPRLNLYDRKV